MPRAKLGGSKRAKYSYFDHDNDLGSFTRQTKRVRTTHDDRDEVREARRRELEALREDLKKKKYEQEIRIDAPGGFEVGEDFNDDSDLLDWVEGELSGNGNGVSDHMVIIEEEDGDEDFEDEDEEQEERRRKAYTENVRQRHKRHPRASTRNRTQIENDQWEALYTRLYDAYLEWDAIGAPAVEESVDQHAPILCISMFDRKGLSFPHDPSKPLMETMVCHGYMPTAPLHPNTGISLQVLEAYRAISSRCPNLGIQPFIHGICDIQKVAFRASYARSFLRAFDVYLEVLDRIDAALDNLLYPTLLSRYQDMCPCCTAELPNEDELHFKMLFTMDGNESLKRNTVQWRVIDENGNAKGVQNIERPDSRTRQSHLFVEASTVDMYKNEVKTRKINPSARKPVVADVATTASSSDTHPTDQVDLTSSPATAADVNEEGSPVDGVEVKTPCVDRWANLSEDSKKKMWGTFDETGVFIAACRHGIVLLLCDMIRSGELAKYPLALTSQLIDLFGDRLMAGYDIGCGFSATANHSKLVGPKVKSKKCSFCCGAFHGHAHCRVCQLQWHPQYIKGAGLEDFEGCERVFSESNRVAAITRHASKFHRRQTILRHFNRWNSDKYAELSRFLINNYKQALWNILDLMQELEKAKTQLKIESDNLFEEWHAEELTYLTSLQSHRPNEVEANEMEYVNVLKKLAAVKANYDAKTMQWVRLNPQHFNDRITDYNTDQRETQRIENANVRGLDSLLILQAAARLLEEKLGITSRWVVGSADWKRVDKTLAERNFDRAIDSLESQVMSRLFELGKMNQAGTGYKQRKHICKVLKARSKAVTSAVKVYNEVAACLGRPTLQLETVLKYVFIGQFDILRLSRHNINEKPWTREPERNASVKYFKLLRSREELQRLNVEICRLHTYIINSEIKMETVITKLKVSNPLLAIQLKKRHAHRHAMNRTHIHRLSDIERWEDFTGDRSPLRTLENAESAAVEEEMEKDGSGLSDIELDDEEDMGDEESGENVLAMLSAIFDTLSIYER